MANGFKSTTSGVTLQITVWVVWDGAFQSSLMGLGKTWWDLHTLLPEVSLNISALGSYFSLQTGFGRRSKASLEGNQFDDSEDWQSYFQLCIKENRDFNRDTYTLLLSRPMYNTWSYPDLSSRQDWWIRGTLRKKSIFNSSNKSPKSKALFPTFILIYCSQHAIIFVLWNVQDVNLPRCWVGGEWRKVCLWGHVSQGCLSSSLLGQRRCSFLCVWVW